MCHVVPVDQSAMRIGTVFASIGRATHGPEGAAALPGSEKNIED